MSKRLVMPDIHTKYERAQQIIDSNPDVNGITFLGDYFDTYGDSPSENRAMAVWLANRIHKHPEDDFLLGNHDMQYIWDLEQCSGFSPFKLAAIRSCEDFGFIRNNLKLFAVHDGWLLSHAGLTNPLVPRGTADVLGWLDHECTRAFVNFKAGVSHWTVKAGRDRGGPELHGGLTWVDFKNFQPVKGIKQLFGHSKGYLPRHNMDNHCIDTALRHYAIIEDGKVTVHDFNAQCAIGLKS